MRQRFSVAIDGPGGAGKGSAAKGVAEHYGIHYVDTGAIYRAVGLGVLRAGGEPGEREDVLRLLPGLSVELRYDEAGAQHTLLNGEDVSGQIRGEEISAAASKVSALPQVRAFLLETQRRLAREDSVVMDGRDIGTVVLPEAEVKIFLTARPETRARRRYLEQLAKGETVEYADVLEQLRQRDERDMNRETAPLRPAPDAVTVDNTDLDAAQTVAAICRVIDARIAQ